MTRKKDKAEVLTGIKGFNHDLTCIGYQFEPGKTYTQSGNIACCSNGFHAIPDDVHPLMVFSYYAPGQSRYFSVEQSGAICRRENDKAASSILSVKVELSLGDLTLRAIDWVTARVDKAVGNTNSGWSGAASNSGEYGAASNSGTSGAASNSGTSGAASNSGRSGAAFSHAPCSKVMCEGDGQALYCTEFADDGSIASVACGITGRDGIKAGTWYHCRNGKLEPVT